MPSGHAQTWIPQHAAGSQVLVHTCCIFISCWDDYESWAFWKWLLWTGSREAKQNKAAIEWHWLHIRKCYGHWRTSFLHSFSGTCMIFGQFAWFAVGHYLTQWCSLCFLAFYTYILSKTGPWMERAYIVHISSVINIYYVMHFYFASPWISCLAWCIYVLLCILMSNGSVTLQFRFTGIVQCFKLYHILIWSLSFLRLANWFRRIVCLLYFPTRLTKPCYFMHILIIQLFNLHYLSVIGNLVKFLHYLERTQFQSHTFGIFMWSFIFISSPYLFFSLWYTLLSCLVWIMFLCFDSSGFEIYYLELAFLCSTFCVCSVLQYFVVIRFHKQKVAAFDGCFIDSRAWCLFINACLE